MDLYQVDVFTNKMFTGNPAGVYLLISPKDEEGMQNVASEMNLSETAFRRTSNTRLFCGTKRIISPRFIETLGDVPQTMTFINTRSNNLLHDRSKFERPDMFESGLSGLPKEKHWQHHQERL